jgi:hypothetical protein
MHVHTAHSPLNLHILSSTSVPFTLTMMQVPNLALTHTNQITVHATLLFQFLATYYFTRYVSVIFLVVQEKKLLVHVDLVKMKT